ncbi:SRPBCC domain-containing protein (plasmid) [Ensifer sp. D2-11]
MQKTVEAKTGHDFKFSPERIFDAWLDPIKVRSWSARPAPGAPSSDIRRVEIDPRVGGKFVFSDMREDGEAVHWGTYLEIDRPRRLAFSWFTSEEDEQENSSIVTLMIEPLESGCRATITHSMDERWAEWVPQTAKGWAVMLRQIDMDFELQR